MVVKKIAKPAKFLKISWISRFHKYICATSLFPWIRVYFALSFPFLCGNVLVSHSLISAYPELVCVSILDFRQQLAGGFCLWHSPCRVSTITLIKKGVFGQIQCCGSGVGSETFSWIRNKSFRIRIALIRNEFVTKLSDKIHNFWAKCTIKINKKSFSSPKKFPKKLKLQKQYYSHRQIWMPSLSECRWLCICFPKQCHSDRKS